MHPIQFPSLRLIESGSPQAFAAIAQRWLTQREAENHLILSTLSQITAQYQRSGRLQSRFFTFQDGPNVLAALIAQPDFLQITWASLEMIPPIVDGLLAANCPINAVTGPGHVAYDLARAWAQRTARDCVIDYSERVYQLARVTHTNPAGGRLAPATAGDLPVVLDWFADLARETRSPAPDNAEPLARQLVRDGHLFLWHQPGPVAMATIADPTPSGISIRHVYVPSSLRRQGHGKTILAVMGKEILATGRRFCFLVTDPANLAADMLLQKVGARTICEYARWRITPPCTPAPA